MVVPDRRVVDRESNGGTDANPDANVHLHAHAAAASVNRHPVSGDIDAASMTPLSLPWLMEWVGRTGISIVFSCALLWWVLSQQTTAMERLAANQATVSLAVERLAVRVDMVCGPPAANYPR